MIELKFALGFDKDGEPIFYDNTVWTLDPKEYYNYDYQRLFSELPKSIHRCYDQIYYVTLDMVKDMDWFEDVFDIDDNYDNLLAEYGLATINSENN